MVGTTVVRERASGSGHVGRGLAGTRSWLRERRGVLELSAEASLASCSDVCRSTDLLGQGGRNAKWRLFTPHSLLARLQQLVNPVLDDVVATLDAQRPNIGKEELTSFRMSFQFHDETWSTSDFVSQTVGNSPFIDTGRGDAICRHFLELAGRVHGSPSKEVGHHSGL